MKNLVRSKGMCCIIIYMVLMVACTWESALGEQVGEDFKQSILALVKAKSRDRVFTPVGSFSVTSRTGIFDRNGKELSIREMPVPCMAKMTLEPAPYGGNPRLIRVQIHKILQGASSEMRVQSPE